MTINRPSLRGFTARVRGLKGAGVLAAFLFLIVSCSYAVQFVDADGRHIYGDYSSMTKNISVVLPTGERLAGKYFPLDRSDLGAKQGSLFVRNDVSTYLGMTDPAEGWQDLRAFLKGNRGTFMEVIFRYNDYQPTGYGVARTDKGDEYRVELGVGLRSPVKAHEPDIKPPGYYYSE
jgi:hypothetical protein